MTNNPSDTTTILNTSNFLGYVFSQQADNFTQVTDTVVVPIPFSLPYINANQDYRLAMFISIDTMDPFVIRQDTGISMEINTKLA